ncbi:MAG: hypothetical protein DRR08_24965 [Candidatus Parabeggiatoa sp. nov. 2]|nr:MAG: hypothetical protein B6247_29515 [Beggiatoa sp. 4572_84]RKZ55202.1 MAG: hypothetical protein DRR08_24965 [Gammaproteobacteria bacterium]
MPYYYWFWRAGNGNCLANSALAVRCESHRSKNDKSTSIFRLKIEQTTVSIKQQNHKILANQKINF